MSEPIETIPPEADAAFIRLLTLIGVAAIRNGQIVFDVSDGLIAGVRPQPVHRFRRKKSLASPDRGAHTHVRSG